MRRNIVVAVQVVSLIAVAALVGCCPIASRPGVRTPPHTGIFIERDETFVELDRASMSFADSSIDPLPTFQITQERPLLVVYTPGESPSDLHMFRIERRPVEDIPINITPKGSDVVHVQPQQGLVAGSYVVMHGEGSIVQNTPCWGFFVGPVETGEAVATPSPVPSPTAKPTPSLDLRIGKVERTPTVEGEYEKEGYEFVVAEVLLRNLGNEPLIVKSHPSIKVIDDRGFEYEAHRGLRLTDGWKRCSTSAGRLSGVTVIIPPDSVINAQAIVQVPVVSQALKLVLSGLPGEEEPVTLDLVSGPPPEGIPPSQVIDPDDVIEVPDIAEVSVQRIATRGVTIAIINLHGYDIDVRDLACVQYIDGQGHVTVAQHGGFEISYGAFPVSEPILPPGVRKLSSFLFEPEELDASIWDEKAVLVLTVFDPRRETESYEILAQKAYNVPSLPYPEIPPWATRPSPSGTIEIYCRAPAGNYPCDPFHLAVRSGDSVSIVITSGDYREWTFFVDGLESETTIEVPGTHVPYIDPENLVVARVDFVAPEPGEYSLECPVISWGGRCGILYVE